MASDAVAVRRARSAARLAAIFLAAFVVLAVPADPSNAGGGSLRVEGFTTYTLRAEDSAVKVEIQFDLTNLRPDTVTDDGVIRFFFPRLDIGIPHEAVGVRADSAGQPLSVVITTEPPDGEGPPRSRAVITFPEPLHYQDTLRMTVRFDLPGSPPRSESLVRLNPAYGAFTARAWGDPGLAGVEIAIDTAFEVTTFGVDLIPTTGSDAVVYRATDIADPSSWFVHVSARRDDALAETRADVEGLAVAIFAWPDDAEWASQVRDLVEAGLPYLRDAIGLDYPAVDGVAILEALDPSLLGFAGWYLTDQDRIEMGEHIDAHVVLHELTHLWFNQRLFAERWINEGLAEAYAALAVTHLGAPTDYDDPHLPTVDDPGWVPLNDWVFPEVAPSLDEAVRGQERFGYEASFWVIQAVIDEVGVEAMRAAIDTAAGRRAAYVVEGSAADLADDPRTDWRRFLDLLEERAGSKIAESLYREHVVTADQIALLDERALAREAYRHLADAAFAPPWAVRGPLEAWDFDTAVEVMETAGAVLTAAAEIEAAAAELDLRYPASLRLGYERASNGRDLDRLVGRAAIHLDAVTLIGEAQAAVDGPRSVLTRLGLIASNVDRQLATARAAFEAEDPERAASVAADVLGVMEGAHDAGRLRAFWAGGIALVLIGLGVTWAVVSMRRRRAPAEGA